jgi:type I restriction enzyme R subunit
MALLRVDPAFQGLRTRITEIASLLEELGNVPMVAAEMAFILEVQTDEFWQNITLPMLETVRRRLRALVKLIEYKKRLLVYSDFEDRAGTATDVTVLHSSRHGHGCLSTQGSGVSQAARGPHRRAQG